MDAIPRTIRFTIRLNMNEEEKELQDEVGENFEFDTGMLDEAVEAFETAEDQAREVEQAQQVEQDLATQDQVAQDELDDPRNAKNWGLKAYVKEAQSALTGGVQDTLSSAATFPERTLDAISGEMAREKKEKGYYQPEWTPFNSYENPIITKTWWGKLARGTVHFGTMAAAIFAAVKSSPLTVPAGLKGMASYSLLRAAGIGAVSDIISKESDGHNALGSLRDHYGFIDTPLSTKETDHPMMMKFKNVVEGMGIGLVFDGAAMLIGKAKKPIAQAVQNRKKSIKDQTLEKGLQELRTNEQEFRAAKNRPMADAHQGAFFSEDDAYEVYVRNKRIREDWGSSDGSAGNVITAVQRERGAQNSGLSEEVVDEVLQKLYSKNKYKALIREAKENRQSLVETFGDAIAAHQRITLGRNAAEMSADEYLEELLKSTDAYEVTDIDGNIIDRISTITSKYVVVADMVVGTLLQQVRDLGIAGRELRDFVDITDVDGPLEQIRNTMFMALTEAKRARLIKSDDFRALGAGKRRFLEKTLTEEMKDTREAIQTILNIANKEEDGDLLMALFEAFSSMKTVNSLDDFDAWARKMIRGGEIEGKNQTGALVRELQGVMTHSILSGPKTPMRAIMGTSTATFMRPMAQTLGAITRLPFTGDTKTLRTGLAQMNAMIQAIPESFEIFKTKLNGYWSGDLASIKTRFSEYTKGDDNWEILRRYVEESNRASVGDKAAFFIANIARNLNKTNFLTYGVNLMAATDDAFAHILGRMKMREKALLSAMNQQETGALSSFVEITPQLIKDYEDFFYRDIFDANGNIIEEATKFARKEVTLTQDLTGFAQGLNAVFQANPWAKPFFLFARTGINGLKLTAKHTPGFNFLVKEFNDIAFATKVTDDLRVKYGIVDQQDLINAKALQTGRLAMGSALVFMASQAWMRGELTGNGPVDRQKRQVWIDAGYKPRHITLGGVQVGYDSFEPFNQVMSMIADIGDASQLMGEEWTQDNLLKVALLLSQGVTSKSYLAGLQSFADLFGGKPGQPARIIAGITNNAIPLAGLRNELGKMFNPYMKELQSGYIDSVRNRNLLFEKLPGADLPIKYDILNGKPLKPYDFMTRAYNMFSPVSLSLTPSAGRTLLFNSGYDLRLSVLSSPDGDDLSDSPRLRSEFQKAIGETGLEAKLARLAKSPRIIASLEEMYRDINSGNRAMYETKDYYHNRIIDNLFQEARRIAWAKVSQGNQELVKLKEEERKKRVLRQRKFESSANPSQDILNIYK